MSKPTVIEKIPINVVDVKEALEKIQKTLSEDEELNFRAGKTLEYGQDFAKLKPKQAAELYGKLMALDVPRMRDVHAHKLIDLMPTSEKQTKLILNAYHLTVTNENVKKIVAAITDFS